MKSVSGKIVRRPCVVHSFAVIAFTCAFSLLSGPSRAENASVHVLAAASLTTVIDQWQADPEIGAFVPVIASSGALARQITAGAPADIFLSANPRWADHVREQVAQTAEQAVFAHNQLVLIAPTTGRTNITQMEGLAVLSDLSGTDRLLAIGDPAHVPAGSYAREALASMGLWDALSPNLRLATNVRSVLALVDRGEVEAGIVYATDAVLSPRVRTIAPFPESSHRPIAYTALLLTPDRPAARQLYNLLTGSQGAAALCRAGFMAKTGCPQPFGHTQ